MKTMLNTYADVAREIEIIKDQVDFIKNELQYWFGIDLDKEKGIPLQSKGARRYGINTAIKQAEKKFNNLKELENRLQELEYAKVRWDMFLEQFEGLDYKIAYKRIVESKTHQEIADELGYTHQYIRKRWMELRNNKESTDTIAN